MYFVYSVHVDILNATLKSYNDLIKLVAVVAGYEVYDDLRV